MFCKVVEPGHLHVFLLVPLCSALALVDSSLAYADLDKYATLYVDG